MKNGGVIKNLNIEVGVKQKTILIKKVTTIAAIFRTNAERFFRKIRIGKGIRTVE
jgi:hypothetical protein